MTDAAEQPLPGLGVGVEDLVEVGAVAQVGVRDDAGDGRGVGEPCPERRGLLGHVLGLTDAPQVLGPVGPVARVAFHEHRRHHVVPRPRVGAEVVEPVAAQEAAPGGPEMMVGIDDLDVGIDDLLGHLREPLRGTGLHDDARLRRAADRRGRRASGCRRWCRRGARTRRGRAGRRW